MLLQSALAQATEHLGIYVPAVHVLSRGNFPIGPVPPPNATTSLPDSMSQDDPRLLPVDLEEVESLPLPIALRGPNISQSVLLSDEDRSSVEKATRGQSTNVEWFRQRMGSITASSMAAVCRACQPKSRADKGRLADRILSLHLSHMREPKLPNKDSLKWGHMNEDKARQQYLSISAPNHNDLMVTETGLMIHPEHDMIRASPDGIVTCQCHPARLLEIKCPYGARDMDIKSAVESKKISYLKDNEGQWELSETSEGYLTQVQTTMAVCKLMSCDFVVYTKKELLVVHVPFNPSSWEVTLRTALFFFEEHAIPALQDVSSVNPLSVPSTPESLHTSNPGGGHSHQLPYGGVPLYRVDFERPVSLK